MGLVVWLAAAANIERRNEVLLEGIGGEGVEEGVVGEEQGVIGEGQGDGAGEGDGDVGSNGTGGGRRSC